MKDLDAVDSEIMEAEVMLEMARIEELETMVNYGERGLKAAIEQASTHATQYQNILMAAGKDSFTKEEFEAEELKYYAKSAWYHASVVFNVSEIEIDYNHDYEKPKPPARDENGNLKPDRFVTQTVNMQDEMVLYFECMGITRSEVEQELKDLSNMRAGFDIAHGGGGMHVQSFEAHFTSWLNRMVDKYLPRIEKAAANGGISAVRRISKLIDPNAQADVDDMGTKKSRRSALR